jgi:hypothetical protein
MNSPSQDAELRKIQEQRKAAQNSILPPVRNSQRKEKQVQIGPSDVEKQKSDKKKDSSGDKGDDGMSKHQKYYQYDYFKVLPWCFVLSHGSQFVQHASRPPFPVHSGGLLVPPLTCPAQTHETKPPFFTGMGQI